MYKQDNKKGDRYGIFGRLRLKLFVIPIISVLIFSLIMNSPLSFLLFSMSDLYCGFVYNDSIEEFIAYSLRGGSNIVISKKEDEGEVLLTLLGNESIYKSGFAINYVRDELPIRTEISDEDKEDLTMTSVQFDKLLSQYSKMTFNELVGRYYIVDSSTTVTEEIINVNDFLQKDCTMNEGEKILIYHTHGSEGFADSDGSADDSVIGVGNYLTELLEEKGYEVIHDTTYYDRENGVVNRNVAYSQALEGITKILEENPDISVVIDLHRDSGSKRVVNIDGKDMCRVMLFNGLSYDADGEIEYLPNPNRESNLAFSFQLKLMADALYDGYMSSIYLRNYRYNMHVCPKSILVEVGTQENTVSEAYNSMEVLAEVLDSVLKEAE